MTESSDNGPGALQNSANLLRRHRRDIVNRDTWKVPKTVNIFSVKAVLRSQGTTRTTMRPGEDVDVIPTLKGLVHDMDEVFLPDGCF